LGFELRFLGGHQPLIINGRTIWITDAHRGYGKRFVVRADEKLTVFLELEAAIRVPLRPFSESFNFLRTSLLRLRRTAWSP